MHQAKERRFPFLTVSCLVLFLGIGPCLYLGWTAWKRQAAQLEVLERQLVVADPELDLLEYSLAQQARPVAWTGALRSRKEDIGKAIDDFVRRLERQINASKKSARSAIRRPGLKARPPPVIEGWDGPLPEPSEPALGIAKAYGRL